MQQLNDTEKTKVSIACIIEVISKRKQSAHGHFVTLTAVKGKKRKRKLHLWRY